MLSSVQGLKWQMFPRVKVPDVWSSDLYVYFTPASTSNKPLLNELPLKNSSLFWDICFSTPKCAECQNLHIKMEVCCTRFENTCNLLFFF